jgi:hypothetical protein
MPRTLVTAKASNAVKNKHETIKKAAGLSKPKGIQKVVRKPTKFKRFTTTTRRIRKKQDDTWFCNQKAPIVDLVKSIARDVDNQTWFRKSTCRTIDEIVTAQVIIILRQALERRKDAMTPSKMKKQTAIQIGEKHITGALKVWAEYHDGNYMDVYRNTLVEQKELERSLHPERN